MKSGRVYCPAGGQGEDREPISKRRLLAGRSGAWAVITGHVALVKPGTGDGIMLEMEMEVG